MGRDVLGAVVAGNPQEQEAITSVGKSLSVTIGGGGVQVVGDVSATPTTLFELVGDSPIVGVRAVTGAADSTEAGEKASYYVRRH